MIDSRLFYFSLYYSRVYLHLLQKWLEEVMEKKFPFKYKADGTGKIKRITIPFRNIYKGETIFREGEEVIFLETEKTSPEWARLDLFQEDQENRVENREGDSDETGKNKALTARVLSADEECLEIIFTEAPLKELLAKMGFFVKGGNLLQLMIKTYLNVCSGYSDLSRQDWIYRDPSHYDRPEDFLRGGLANNNLLHLPIWQVKLEGASKRVLYDESQLRGLLDIWSPTFLSVISGGPGGGKTTQTAVAIKELVRRGQVVCISSHSNQGLGNALEVLAQHMSPNQIFLLGNNYELIVSEKIQKFHRYYRYRRQVDEIISSEEADQTRVEERGVKENMDDNKNHQKKLDSRHKAVALRLENEAIWKLICSGQGLVIAVTVNSFQFDHQLSRLYAQNSPILKADFQNLPSEEENIKVTLPESVISYMQKDNDRCDKIAPQFAITTTFIDEATKLMPYELVAFLKNTESKIVLVGDIDQLGNLGISLETKQRMWAMADFDFDRVSPVANQGVLRPKKLSIHDYAVYQNKDKDNDKSYVLLPRTTSLTELGQYLNYYAEGFLHTLIHASNLEVNYLEINRRSLEVIVHFLNRVFNKKMKVGRFNPHKQGEITFLDILGQEERMGTSYKNVGESKQIVADVLKFYRQQFKAEGQVNLRSLGIITFYNAQVNDIKAKLRKELLFNPIFQEQATPKNINQILKEIVNTVDAFQGSEREAIILSLVRANFEGRLGFSGNIRRLYVAFSRAGDSLIIIGNSRIFLDNPDKKVSDIFGRIINFTQKNKRYALLK